MVWSREAVKELVVYAIGKLKPEDQWLLKRELALEFVGTRKPQEKASPVAKDEPVRRHPRDKR